MYSVFRKCLCLCDKVISQLFSNIYDSSLKLVHIPIKRDCLDRGLEIFDPIIKRNEFGFVYVLSVKDQFFFFREVQL